MNSLVAFFSCFFFYSVSFAQSGVTVVGHLDKPSNNQKIIISRYDGHQYHAVDSVVTNNISFSFQRPNSVVNMYSLNIAGKNGRLMFVWDSNITVKLNTDSLWLSAVEGSPASDEYLIYQKNLDAFRNQLIYYSNKRRETKSEDSVKYYDAKQDQVMDSVHRFSIHYLKTNKPSYTTMSILHWVQNSKNMSKDEILPYYNLLPNEWKQHSMMQHMIMSLDREAEIERSYTEKLAAPQFSAKNLLTQKEVNLEKLLLEKKPIILDFWGIWCGPCIKSIPDLKQAHSILKDKVNFISIAWDSEKKREQTKTFIDKKGMNWIHLFENRDLNNSDFLNIKYAIDSYPTLVLIDADGRLSRKAEGTIEVKELLDELTKSTK